MNQFIKIYCQKSSGSNYLQFLLEKNYSIFVLRNCLAWKHSPYVVTEIDWSMQEWGENALDTKYSSEYCENQLDDIKQAFAEDNIRYIFCFKNPYHFVISNNGYDRDKINNNKQILRLVSLWNTANNNYFEYYLQNNYKSLLCRSEDLLDENDVINFLNLTSDKFNIQRVSKEVVRHNRRMGLQKNIKTKSDDKISKRYDSKENLLEYLSHDSFLLIKNLADTRLMEVLHYNLI
jgi:hypothetical protein